MVLGVFFLNSEKTPFVRGAAPFHLNVIQYSPINRYSAVGSDIRIQFLHTGYYPRFCDGKNCS